MKIETVVEHKELINRYALVGTLLLLPTIYFNLFFDNSRDLTFADYYFFVIYGDLVGFGIFHLVIKPRRKNLSRHSTNKGYSYLKKISEPFRTILDNWRNNN